MDSMAVTIGERVRAARERRGWTQSELARAIGRPRQYIFNLEHGKMQPRPQLIAELALCLGVSADFLLGIADEVESEPEPAAVA